MEHTIRKYIGCGCIHRGDTVQVLERKDVWAKINDDGGIAYVCAQYITAA